MRAHCVAFQEHRLWNVLFVTHRLHSSWLFFSTCFTSPKCGAFCFRRTYLFYFYLQVSHTCFHTRPKLEWTTSCHQWYNNKYVDLTLLYPCKEQACNTNIEGFSCPKAKTVEASSMSHPPTFLSPLFQEKYSLHVKDNTGP